MASVVSLQETRVEMHLLANNSNPALNIAVSKPGEDLEVPYQNKTHIVCHGHPIYISASRAVLRQRVFWSYAMSDYLKREEVGAFKRDNLVAGISDVHLSTLCE
jgi:hypothetical protein